MIDCLQLNQSASKYMQWQHCACLDAWLGFQLYSCTFQHTLMFALTAYQTQVQGRRHSRTFRDDS